MNRFQNFLKDGHLVSLPASSEITNPVFLNLFPFVNLENLPIVGSDHGPMCLTLKLSNSLVGYVD